MHLALQNDGKELIPQKDKSKHKLKVELCTEEERRKAIAEAQNRDDPKKNANETTQTLIETQAEEKEDDEREHSLVICEDLNDAQSDANQVQKYPKVNYYVLRPNLQLPPRCHVPQ